MLRGATYLRYLLCNSYFAGGGLVEDLGSAQNRWWSVPAVMYVVTDRLGSDSVKDCEAVVTTGTCPSRQIVICCDPFRMAWANTIVPCICIAVLAKFRLRTEMPLGEGQTGYYLR